MRALLLGRWLCAARRDGGDGRELEMARLVAREHQVTLAFATDDVDDVHGLATLRGEFGDLEFAAVPRGWKYLTGAISLATGDSCSMAYFRSPALSARLADRMKAVAYDFVLVSGSSMIQYALALDPAVPLVVDFGEVDSEWWRRQAELRSFPGANFYRTEATRLRSAEAAAASRASACVVASSAAARVVASFAPWAPVTVIPSGATPDGHASGASALARLVALVTRSRRPAAVAAAMHSPMAAPPVTGAPAPATPGR